MPTPTTNYGLNKPDRGQTDWDSLINGDLDSIDTLLYGKQDTSEKGQANGYPALDSSGKVPSAQLPTPTTQLAQDTDVAITTPADGEVLRYDAAAGKWKNQTPGFAPVTTVAGRTGDIVLVEGDVANLTSDLAAKEATANKGQANGYASLDGSTKVPVAQIPAISESGVTNLVSDLAATEKTANKGVANGYASLDSGGKVPTGQIPAIAESGVTGLVSDLAAKEATANKGVANGYASLDSGGKVPTGQLPALGSATLAGDTDVVLTSPANDDVLTYETSSSKWKNKPAAGAVTSVAGKTGVVTLVEGDITNLTTDLAAKVPTSRSISTTAPLTGGGDLSANRTLDISNFTGDSGSGGTKGAVPAPSAGDADALKYLSAAGTFSTAPITASFYVNSASTATGVAVALSPRAGSFTKCKVLVKASDALTALQLRIKKNGVDIFSSDPTVTANTASGTVVSLTSSLSSNPTTVAQDDVLQLDILQGTSSWVFVVQLES
jgi:hypothetical protein